MDQWLWGFFTLTKTRPTNPNANGQVGDAERELANIIVGEGRGTDRQADGGGA